MECHYSVLEVERTASDQELKKSYRKLALVWHPDKNPDRIEEATQRFAQIQVAYELLSDPQEREWYDNHREAILKGRSYKDDGYSGCNDGGLSENDLMGYFSTSCGSFNNPATTKKFYEVYHGLFEKLAKTEEDIDDTYGPLPRFGKETEQSYENSKLFYNYWSTFSTVRDFAWEDIYNPSNAPDRRTRRAMEKDNKKLRDNAKKSFNETVRRLVNYIQKKDLGFKKTKSDASNKKKQLEEERKVQAEEQRRKLKLEAKTKIQSAGQEYVPEWAQITDKDLAVFEDIDAEVWQNDLDDNVNAENYGLNSDLDNDEVIDLYCIACDKEFDNTNQMKHHESSKKHAKAMQRLKLDMLSEEKDLVENILDSQFENFELNSNLKDFNSSSVNTFTSKSKKKADKKKKRQEQLANMFNEALEIDIGHMESVHEIEESTSLQFILDQAEEFDNNENVTNNSSIEIKHSLDIILPKKPKEKPKENDGKGQTCVSCKQMFSSKTKLFHHLKEYPDHAAIKEIKSRKGKRTL